MRTLKKSRGAIGELTSKAGQLEADTSSVDGLRDGIKGIDAAIDKVGGPRLYGGKGIDDY